MKPKGYKDQPACATCQFVFIKTDYDEGESYYCTKLRKKRPKCGSTAMREEFTYPPIDAPDEQWANIPDVQAWERWARQQTVKPWQVCNSYSQGEEEGRDGAMSS